MPPTRKEWLSLLPEGTRFCQPGRTYRYRAFSMDDRFLHEHFRGFDWQQHITRTFHECLAGTMNRFMKVV